MIRMELEPLVSEEQGVVYLFARYWDKIVHIKKMIKEIKIIRVHFPDGLYINNEGFLGGIEFEHKLSGFWGHIDDDKKKIQDIQRFYIDNKEDFPVKSPFLVIYWNKDDDEADIRTKCKKLVKGINVEFVNLSENFYPFIEKDKEMLIPYWSFNLKHTKKDSLNKILNKCKNLKTRGIINIFPKPQRDNIKIIGFNPKKAADVDYKHWGLINFFTTGSDSGKKKTISEVNPPNKILIVPKGSNCIEAGFKVEMIFKIKKKHILLKEFFKNNYFWPYDVEYNKSYCIVYSNFKIIPKNRGKNIFKEKFKSSWQSSGLVVEKITKPSLYNILNSLLR